MRNLALLKIYFVVFAQSNFLACCFQPLSSFSKFSELQIRSKVTDPPVSRNRNDGILKSHPLREDHSGMNQSFDRRQYSDAALDDDSFKRRSFLRHSFGLFSVPLFCQLPADARGLVKFPIKDGKLLNNYHFMRAGESLLEEEGVWSTNPLFLTNREAALSSKGIQQVEQQCFELKEEGIAPTVVRYSLAASAIDSANIVGRDLKVGRDRLVPEFNFMDPRAIGKWDMLPLDSTQAAVWAMDVFEAGKDGNGGRPPENEDGTPPETLSDQVVRLQQLISVLETQYSGDTILLIFPDGTGPALLSCLIGGIPLNRVHELEYRPGEIRLNISYDNVNSYTNTDPSLEYIETIERGKKVLSDLRENESEIMNVRDAQYAEELRVEKELKTRKEKEAEERELRLAVEKEERARKAVEREERIKKEREERIAQSKQNRKNEIENRAKKSAEERSVDTVKDRVTDTEATVIIGATTIGAVFASTLLQEDEPLTERKNATENVTPENQVSKNQSTMKTNVHENAAQSFDTNQTEADLDSSKNAGTTTSTLGTNSQSTNTPYPDIESLEVSNRDIKSDRNVVSLEKEARNGAPIDGSPILVPEETPEKPSLVLEDKALEDENPNISASSGWDPDEDDGGIAWLNALNEIANED